MRLFGFAAPCCSSLDISLPLALYLPSPSLPFSHATKASFQSAVASAILVYANFPRNQCSQRSSRFSLFAFGLQLRIFHAKGSMAILARPFLSIPPSHIYPREPTDGSQTVTVNIALSLSLSFLPLSLSTYYSKLIRSALIIQTCLQT